MFQPDPVGNRKPDPRCMAGILLRESFDCDDPLTKRVMQHAAEDYEKRARGIERATKSLAVFELPSKASSEDLLNARKRGAVRYCGRIYAPIALERHLVLPSTLLRSALFSAASGESELSAADVPIVKTKDGDVSLTVSGPRLNGQDRRVLGACLNLYRGNGPTAIPLGQEVELSLYRFAFAMGLKPGRHVYDSLLSSFDRLGAVRCELSLGDVQQPLCRLIVSDVKVGELGKTTVTVRVDEAFAVLLRRGMWVSMPTTALAEFTGLAGWLVCYLRTQSGPYPLTHDYLLRHSGSTCSLAEFRRRLKMAVTTLSGPNVDPYLRISQFYWEPNSVVFMLARWPGKAAVPQLKKALEMQRRYSH
ncbi:hypothetical protein [Pollutimonas harenae]|uniref:Uncharacterized protein n=1 Tax=Pollutimonas harenae TaxID=657015 RepID=A0A853H021_9BURK|nr:hypothetical protein [Pollutimonas harenae]NYT85029.1 hypothetical protein [Pollutimonas harenae]TEA72586.1 hypothetical protein ERD84_01350 [Pollutimonas harenae]